MILMLSTLFFTVFVNCGAEKITIEDNISSNRLFENFKETENATKVPSMQLEEEMVPNYFQSDFHDFVSADQGLTYNYEASKNKPKFYKKYRSQNSRNQSEQQSHKPDPLYSTRGGKLVRGDKTAVPVKMYNGSSKNKYSRKEDRLPHDIGYIMAKASNTYPENDELSAANARSINGKKHKSAKPLGTHLKKFDNHGASAVDIRLVHDIKDRKTKKPKTYRENYSNLGVSLAEVGLIHDTEHKIVPLNMQTNEYPATEDRLPVTDASIEEDQTENFPKTEKGRKPRAVRDFTNIPGFLLHKGSNRRIGMGYRPQSDFHTMMSTMKDVDRQDHFGEYDVHDNDFSSISSLLLNPLPILAASFLPLSMMFAAVIPVIIRNRFSNVNGNVPLVTTTATGNSGKNGENGKNMSFLAATAEAIGKISPRNHENGCVTKALCKMVNSDKYATFYTQNVFSELQKYVDGNLLDPFGLKTVLKYLEDGKCEEIKCN